MLVASAEVRRQVADARHHAESFAARNEFLPRTARQPPGAPRGDRPLVEAQPPQAGQVRFLPGHGPHHIAAEVDVRAPAELVINQLYFPGWQVRLDGRTLSPEALAAALRPDGLIRVPVAHGAVQRVEARYAGPPGGMVRWGGVLLGLSLLAGLALHERRTAERGQPGVRDPSAAG